MENSTSLIKFNSEIEIPELKEVKIKGKDYVSYGIDNIFPTYLLHLYNSSTTHQSIVDGCVNYTLGSGLLINDPQLKVFSENVNKDKEKLTDILRKCELDYQIFGGFAVQIILNKLGSLAEIYWIDFSLLRTNDIEDKVYYSKEFGKWGAKAIEYDIFNIDKPKSNTIFYYKGKKTRGVYPVPLYNAALKSIQIDVQITDFHLNNINTNFGGNTIINMNNGVPTEEAKTEIERNIKKKFTGTQADKVLISYNDNVESAVTITKLDSDDFDKKYEALNKNTQNTIFSSHRITSPALFGVIIENQGFSKTEFVESFEIYNTTVIEPLQKDLTLEFEKILYPFFTDSSFNILPFSLNINTIIN